MRLPDLTEPDWEKLRAKWETLREASPNTPRWNSLCRYWKRLLLALSPLELDWQHGLWNFSHIDLGPKEVDKNTPNNFWCAKLHLLNQWAAKRGDAFVISPDGVLWFDEWGWHTSLEQLTLSHKSTGGTRAPTKRMQSDWVESAKEIAMSVKTKTTKPLTLNKLAELVRNEMVKKHTKNEPGMTGRGGKIPSTETIVRHALQKLV